jgi:hypothetical protein
MSTRDLFKAMNSMDFSKSQRILAGSLTSGELADIVALLRQESETGSEHPLMIRDHVFSFLRAFPVYIALNINSYDLLSSVADFVTAEDAFEECVRASQSAFEMGPDAFNSTCVEIDDLATNSYSVLIVGILKHRTQELDSARLFMTRMKSSRRQESRTRYDISNLWRTAYGARVLISIGLKPSERFIGQAKWTLLHETLEQLGYRSENILSEVTEAEWSQLTSSKQHQSSASSKELAQLELLRNYILELDSPDTKTRTAALHEIEDLGTISCTSRIVKLARQGMPSAIALLGETGSQIHEPLLEFLLTSADRTVRETAARALSKVSSRRVLGTSAQPPQFRERASLVDHELNGYYQIACSENKLARLDAMRAITSIDSQRAEQTMLSVYGHLDTIGRVELLNLIQDMRRPMAAVLIKRALEDKDDEVRVAALRIGEAIWPEQEW